MLKTNILSETEAPKIIDATDEIKNIEDNKLIFSPPISKFNLLKNRKIN